MRLPNWFKIAWWAALTALLTYFLFLRYPDLVVGKAAAADVVVFIIWIALLLAPLFNEVSLLGITLKQQIEDLKGFVSSQVTELRNAVDVRTSISQQFTLPANDAKLPDIENMVKNAVAAQMSAQGKTSFQPADLAAPPDVSLLFAARYNIERELRRIAEGRQVVSGIASLIQSPPSISQLTRHLTQAELIEPSLASAIREVYSVCSPAIHGEQVTTAQVRFVKDVAPELVAALRAVP
jgi:hypothetical protein